MMKSLACFVMGIAMIAFVLPGAPMRHVLAQNPGGTTLAQHLCANVWTPTPTQGSLDCIRATQQCENYRRYYALSVGSCVPNPAESISCYEWMEPWYVEYPIVYEASYLTPYQIGLILASVAGAICSGIDYVYSIIPKNFKVIKVAKNTNVPGIVVTIVCAGVTYTVTDMTLNACDFGFCKVDWSAGPTLGANVKRCY